MNASAPVALFTASQIASASGLSKRAVLLALANVPPSEFSNVQGGQAGQWPFAALPDRLRIRLETVAQSRFCRDAEALLRHPVKVWPSPVMLAEVSEETRTRAVKLQRALARPIACMNDLSVTPGELVAIGLEDYCRVFGFDISPRHWNRLMKRVVERDGGLENWSRLEIYLDEVVRRAKPTLQALANAAQWTELSEVLSSFANPLKPTSDELSLFWTLVFEQYERALEEKKKRDVKGSLLAFLLAAAPVLSDTASALKRQFNRKHARWVADGRKPSAVADRRSTNSGRFRAPVVSAEDADKLVGHATLFHGGRVSQAWKALSEKRELNHDLLHYYERSVASPDIPRAVRSAVLPEIERLNDIHHGPRQTKLNGPHIDRDWSGVHVGDWYQSDDCTLPVYFYVPDGQGWFALMRGQFLPMIDLRSKCVLEFALLPSPNYNSQAIRTLITRTCDAHGLPRRGFYFENGIWKSSKIIAGVSSNLAWNDTERGLRDLGLEFRHAKMPRAKPVEHVLGLLQDMMEGERGYVGRDERHEKFERVQKQMLLVKGAKEHPSKFFYSFEEWQLRLREICEQYNATEQRGKMTEGRAPEVAFEEFQDKGNPSIRLDASSRYLLAHHQRKLRVKRTGIHFKIGKQTYTYVNERTGQLVGEDVIAWFNPELPDLLCVTDLNRENPFAVERLQSLPAMDATPEQMASAHSQISAHLAHAKTHYCTLKAKFAPKFRQNFVTPETAELGRAFAQETEKAETKARETRGRFDRTHRAARALNLTPSQAALQRPEAAPAMERLHKGLCEDDGEEMATAAAPAAGASKGKIYVLKTPPASVNLPQLRSQYWASWKRVETVKPGTQRHALTRRALGYIKKVNEFNAEELTKLVSVFSAIVRDAKKGTVNE